MNDCRSTIAFELQSIITNRVAAAARRPATGYRCGCCQPRLSRFHEVSEALRCCSILRLLVTVSYTYCNGHGVFILSVPQVLIQYLGFVHAVHFGLSLESSAYSRPVIRPVDCRLAIAFRPNSSRSQYISFTTKDSSFCVQGDSCNTLALKHIVTKTH